MYTTCMFCNKPLGTNQVVETFPVGRRLAFEFGRADQFDESERVVGEDLVDVFATSVGFPENIFDIRHWRS